MLKHIVMWKLKEEAEGAGKKQNALEMKKRLEKLKGPISEIQELEVGLQMEPSPFVKTSGDKPEAAYDLVLYSTFRDKGDLEKYQKHPEHQKVVEFVKKVVADRKVVDYEV
jgi:hypothetical protein